MLRTMTADFENVQTMVCLWKVTKRIRNLFYRFVDTLPVQGYQNNDMDVRLPDALYEKMKMVFDVQMIRMIIPIVKSSEINLNTHYCDYDFGMLILKCCILLTR